MYLRNLEFSDAPLMLEWMHDKDLTQYFRTDFSSMEIHNVNEFIKNNRTLNYKNDVNLAVSSDNDEYMGTVSLKHINFDNRSAEFAIVMRRTAMGKGFAWFGMNEIIKIAFDKIALNIIYWNVLKNNIRAIRFYEKHNFNEMINVPEEFLSFYKDYKDLHNLKWYSINKLNSK